MIKERLVVGIDASRNRSGGAKAHLRGILDEGDPTSAGIQEVHVWAYRGLLESVPDRPWLVKHCPDALERSLSRQLWWQATQFGKEARHAGCDIVFVTDATTVSRFKPMVVMSQDMLSYEPGVMNYFGFSWDHLRLWLILFLQNAAFRYSDGVIFLTKYAANIIQKSCGALANVTHIPHGVPPPFRMLKSYSDRTKSDTKILRLIYVSNTAMYKHQWVVVKAGSDLRRKGLDISLKLIGGGVGRAQVRLERELAVSDPNSEFVQQLAFVPQETLLKEFGEVDVFVYASSCENLPVTLLEGMASGLPIACSDRGPMPEVLEDGGVYFDPEDAESIAAAIEKLAVDKLLRSQLAEKARVISEKYSWSRCAKETWIFLADTYRMTRK